MNYRRQALAFLFTPVAAGILQTFLLVLTASKRGQRIDTRFWGFLLVVMTIQALAMTIVGGVPAWYTLRLFRKRSALSFIVAGIIVGVAGVVIRAALGFGAPLDVHLTLFEDLRRAVRLWELGITAIAGAGAALVFRAIAGVSTNLRSAPEA